MDITIGMLAENEERQKRYQRAIRTLLTPEDMTAEFLFYPSLKQLRDAMAGGARVDLLVLQAGLLGLSFAAPVPMTYISAPGGADSLEQAILRAADYLKRTKSGIDFETKSFCLHYGLLEIDYLESQYRLVHIVNRNKKTQTITARLDDVQKRLPASFYRCHQSFLVNMENISFIDKSNREIHFTSGQSVPSSKMLFTGFLEAYRNFREGGDSHTGSE